VQRNQQLLRQFVRIADSKYKTGQGLQSDVLLAQLELSKLLDTEIALQGTRYDQQAALNSLMQRPADAAIVLPTVISEQLDKLPQVRGLREQAVATRPWLQAQREKIEASKSRVELAKKDYYPDFSIGGNYGMRAGRSDLTGIMFSMSLPIFTGSKQDSALAQREAEYMREDFVLEDRRLHIEKTISQAYRDYQTATRQALLFKTGIIPQATQTVASMLAGYQVNKVDFLNLVRSQITSYNYETQYWKAISTANQSLARLEAAIGSPIHISKGKKNHE
jgi:outer membrane protein TolC